MIGWGFRKLGTTPSCFVADTPVLTPTGSKPIQSFKPGEEILARDDRDPYAPVWVSKVEELFILSAPIIEVEVGGRTIATTAEHPFYVQNQSWTAAGDLQVGQLLAGKDGEWTRVTAVHTTERLETVYNLRVSVAHTYFVGAEDWGFAVWVHNTYGVLRNSDGTYDIVEVLGNATFKRIGRSGFKNADDAQRALDFSTKAVKNLEPELALRATAEYDELLKAGKYVEADALLKKVEAGNYVAPSRVGKAGNPIPEISFRSLNDEARQALLEIRGSQRLPNHSWNNRNGRLPSTGTKTPRYIEYTVDTPGSVGPGGKPNRGDRRIMHDIENDLWYYTGNAHANGGKDANFRQIIDPP